VRRLIAGLAVSAAFATVGSATALAGGGNPNGTGPPSQSCQTQLTTGGTTPGNAANSPGSPFDEPGFGPAPNGGTGGLHYSPNSQYDVACYHVSH
jgi:hypothetical protein